MPEPGSDTADFERLMRKSYRLVYRVAYSVLRNAADAEEVTQDAFLRAYLKFPGLQESEKFQAWVARIAWRQALNRRRQSFRLMGRDHAWIARSSETEDPETQAADREFETRLWAQVDLLPEKLRAVVLLIGIDEMDTRTVAEILKIPEGTVRSRLHLARKQLLREVTR